MSISSNTWSKEAGYIWSMIGSAVGFANILSFSALCYKNGGGAFLIPYILAHIFVGFPMLVLEGTIGQEAQLPLVTAMGRAAGVLGRLSGWMAVFSCATIGGFYIVLTGYSVAYTWFAAGGLIDADSSHFFKHVFLHDSGSLHVFGALAISVLIATLAVGGFIWGILVKNIGSGLEKLCTIFLPLLGLLVILFTIAAFFLPGSMVGLKHYLVPDFSRLLDWGLWRDVFGQVFFSLSLGLGIVTGYSRHNKKTFSIPRAMFKVAVGDFIISFISGFAIFGCIGFLSIKNGVSFSDLVTTDSAFEIGFVIFPTILMQFGGFLSRFLGAIFFFSIFIAGVTGVFSIVESVAGNIEVEFKKSRKSAVSIAILGILLMAFPFCFGNGQHLIGAMAPMVLGNVMLFGGIVEIFIFILLAKTNLNLDHKFSLWALKCIILPILTFSLIGSIVHEWNARWQLAELIRWSWLAVIGVLGLCLARKRVLSAPLKMSEQRSSNSS